MSAIQDKNSQEVLKPRYIPKSIIHKIKINFKSNIFNQNCKWKVT
ncbi:hypothetical protein Arnit_2152 [Arcobacter nitrofigilis DSM 7299]|uniref:Uncharacterized protein n=1 Tax=Arcobacter nitrofigilis (strain ATCC 33309 / DSM 7299 / CCUG 15893 / LMG 7604 / NCTC 12251 / CI) TaxID=572480 RepID=D5V0J3_ARCNC|nr:hypothetical protein [Arcobacter nitrofigilis]ADG93805.1 hypothetical protein Arnit_2152 [Arcobacter nitrofigilis DSM 7299]